MTQIDDLMIVAAAVVAVDFVQVVESVASVVLDALDEEAFDLDAASSS
jgi:hypothetical protein